MYVCRSVDVCTCMHAYASACAYTNIYKGVYMYIYIYIYENVSLHSDAWMVMNL